MNTRLALFVVAALLAASSLVSSATTGNEKLTPAERDIAVAQKTTTDNPANADAWSGLALALARRARETADPSYYGRAEEAAQHSLKLVPGNFAAKKVQVWLLLGRHEFAKALDAAKALNKQTPDDVQIYGFLVDANVELGNYSDAESAAQWMLDLRPGNVPALTRAAYLRELFGDIEGARELMDMALQSTSFSEVEDRAWIMTQIAHLWLLQGDTAVAEKMLNDALQLFPNYHYALGRLGEARILQKRYTEAVDLLTLRYSKTHNPENLFDLAEALHRAGRAAEAANRFREFETMALRESGIADNANRELVFYYADYAHRPTEALRIAAMEYARKHDVHTLDAYAWALHANGRSKEAQEVIERALAVGVRESKMLLHAGLIAAENNQSQLAAKYFSQAASLNSTGSEQARHELSKIAVARAAK